MRGDGGGFIGFIDHCASECGFGISKTVIDLMSILVNVTSKEWKERMILCSRNRDVPG